MYSTQELQYSTWYLYLVLVDGEDKDKREKHFPLFFSPFYYMHASHHTPHAPAPAAAIVLLEIMSGFVLCEVVAAWCQNEEYLIRLFKTKLNQNKLSNL